MNDFNDDNANHTAAATLGDEMYPTPEFKTTIEGKLKELAHLRKELQLVCDKVKAVKDDIKSEYRRDLRRRDEYEAGYLDEVTKDLDDMVKTKLGGAISFMKKCLYIRCNDPRINKIEYDGTIKRFGAIIVHCLRYNTHVDDLSMFMDSLLGRSPDMNGFVRDWNIRAMVDYITTSPVLRRVSFEGDCDGDGDDAIATRILTAIQRNCNVKELCWKSEVPAESFQTFLAVVPRLEALWLENMYQDDFTHTQQVQLADAVGSNQSLMRLQLRGNELDSIIRSVANHRPPLIQLSLRSWDVDRNIPPSLSQIIRNTSTLQHLELQYFIFDAGFDSGLLEGLRYHYALPSSSIAILAFKWCKFEDVAAQNFLDFMLSTTYCEQSGGAFLQELEMRFFDNVEKFGHMDLGEAMVSIVTMPPVTNATHHHQQLGNAMDMHGRGTIASKLRVLKLHPLNTMEVFFDAIEQNARDIHVPCLCLSYLRQQDVQRLASSVPHLLFLQELHLEEVARNVSSYDLVSIVRQSSSIGNASFLDVNGDSILSRSHTRMVDAYCERNKVLRSMRTIKSSDGHRGDNESEDNNPNKLFEVLQSNDITNNDALLLPMLLVLAQQVETTSVSTMMSVMLAFEMSGPTETNSTERES